MEPMGSQKHEINPETLGMEGMVGWLSWEPVGQTITGPYGSRRGHGLHLYERRGHRMGSVLASFGTDRIIRRVRVHDRRLGETSMRDAARRGRCEEVSMASKKIPADRERQDQVVAEALRYQAQREQTYRAQALKLYPWICARCGREFS